MNALHLINESSIKIICQLLLWNAQLELEMHSLSSDVQEIVLCLQHVI